MFNSGDDEAPDPTNMFARAQEQAAQESPSPEKMVDETHHKLLKFDDEQVGIDLGDSANLKELEDPQLIQRMASARDLMMSLRRDDEVTSRQAREKDKSAVELTAKISEMNIALQSQYDHTDMVFSDLYAIRAELREISPESYAKFIKICTAAESLSASSKKITQLFTIFRRDCEAQITK